jgi:16S rRNA (guanine527-N7)-methyltransferase
MAKRTTFLEETLAWEGAPITALVLTARAEDAARAPDLEGSFELVVARSFGPPAVVAECATRFLRIGGELFVSEPPADTGLDRRWDHEGLRRLGLSERGLTETGPRIRTIYKVDQTPDEFPRRNGVPGKRPLF